VPTVQPFVISTEFGLGKFGGFFYIVDQPFHCANIDTIVIFFCLTLLFLLFKKIKKDNYRTHWEKTMYKFSKIKKISREFVNH
jgi:hypothetical protein